MTKAGKEYLRQCFRKVGLNLGWAPRPHVARILKDGDTRSNSRHGAKWKPGSPATSAR